MYAVDFFGRYDKIIITGRLFCVMCRRVQYNGDA